MIINSGVGGQDRLPLTKQVTITSADWSEETKLATVSADWAMEGMSATISPDEDSMTVFSDVTVQGVYLIQILNGYLVFKSGSGAVVDSSITMNIIASNDGRGVIVNTSIVAEFSNGIGVGGSGTLIASYPNTTNGVNLAIDWEVPAKDDEGYPIYYVGGGNPLQNYSNGRCNNWQYIRRLYLKNNVKGVTSGAFDALNSGVTPPLEHIFIGKQVTKIPINPVANGMVFRNCVNLKSLEIEERDELLTLDTDSGGYGGYATFSGCTGLKNVRIPALVSAKGALFNYCTGLKSLRYESSYQLSDLCKGCSALEELTFTNATQVSITSPTDLFNSAHYIYVPYDSLTAYTTATNWVSYAQYMYGIGKFTAGATLPAQTTDTNFNLTWYATKADLKAGTNPITTAPSEFDNEYGEIYCTKTAVA